MKYCAFLSFGDTITILVFLKKFLFSKSIQWFAMSDLIGLNVQHETCRNKMAEGSGYCIVIQKCKKLKKTKFLCAPKRTKEANQNFPRLVR